MTELVFTVTVNVPDYYETPPVQVAEAIMLALRSSRRLDYLEVVPAAVEVKE